MHSTHGVGQAVTGWPGPDIVRVHSSPGAASGGDREVGLTHQRPLLLVRARDRVLERHPNLRVVGAHLGSMEYDTDEVAKRLEKYPNFAVDSSARLLDLAVQDKDKVREFFIRYADRLLFGTDLGGGPHSAMDADKLAVQLEYMAKRYEGEFSFYESKGEVSVEWWGPTHRLQGLGLPPDMLGKFYVENAKRWIPGV